MPPSLARWSRRVSILLAPAEYRQAKDPTNAPYAECRQLTASPFPPRAGDDIRARRLARQLCGHDVGGLSAHKFHGRRPTVQGFGRRPVRAGGSRSRRPFEPDGWRTSSDARRPYSSWRPGAPIGAHPRRISDPMVQTRNASWREKCMSALASGWNCDADSHHPARHDLSL
jgi:hypothetical protein